MKTYRCIKIVIKIGKGTKLIEAVIRMRDRNTEIPEWEELKERGQENSTLKNENKAIKINYVSRVIDTETHEINRGCFRIDPESIFIGELEIKFLGDTPFKHLELVELQDFDHRLLRKSTQTEERAMPELPIWTIRPNRKKEKNNEMEALLRINSATSNKLRVSAQSRNSFSIFGC